MIINIKNKNDLITLDLRTYQIRYLKDFKQKGRIFFINISRDDADAYDYLFKEDLKVFKKCIKEDILNNIGIKINRLQIL